MTADDKLLKATSKFLSYVLRHHPESIALTLDAQGWAEIEELVAKAQASGRPLSRALLQEVVTTNAKQRFAISADGQRVRANQGHTIPVELGYQPSAPPELLFHGTVAASVPAIRLAGLRKMDRHHVHLSPDQASARAVGGRRGKPVVLQIAAHRMHAAGHVFFVSTNGVWLTEQVPPEYIELSDSPNAP